MGLESRGFQLVPDFEGVPRTQIDVPILEVLFLFVTGLFLFCYHFIGVSVFTYF